MDFLMGGPILVTKITRSKPHDYYITNVLSKCGVTSHTLIKGLLYLVLSADSPPLDLNMEWDLEIVSS
jgi:hypothetical protein